MENNNYKTPRVVPVKADAPNPKILPVHPNIPQCPALLLGIGAVRSVEKRPSSIQ